MRVGISYGRERLELDVPTNSLIQPHRPEVAPELANPADSIRGALESPRDYPALRRALTPDDHVVIVVDEVLPRLAELLTPILEHVCNAGVSAESITLLCEPSPSLQTWLEDLPDDYAEVCLEIHDPRDRKHLSYLATTRHGRRIYLNRTAVDADQLVLLSGRRYDPVLGVSGCEGALYPALSDEATRQAMFSHLSPSAPQETDWPVRREAAEVGWLVGAPFVVQIIEGAGDGVAHVVCGPLTTSAEGDRLLNARWQLTVPERADTVVASISGDPGRERFSDLARALASAARVVRPQGRIILLSQASPPLEAGIASLSQAEDPVRGLQALSESKPPDLAAAFQWVTAVAHAQVYLLSGLPAETAEGLFTVPLDDASQVQRLVEGVGSILVLEDAHRTLAVVDGGSR
jgi:nickel-dependent lactate racemase